MSDGPQEELWFADYFLLEIQFVTVVLLRQFCGYV